MGKLETRKVDETIWVTEDIGTMPPLPEESLDDKIRNGRIIINKMTREIYTR